MPPPPTRLRRERPPLLFGAACALVLAVFWVSAHSGLLELLGRAAASSSYNLLVKGFQHGQLSLDRAVPPGLARLRDPYDPAANQPYRYAPYLLHDLSFYQGKLYLYFGVAPALLLFWPWVALTGHYLLHREAAAIFCSIGFLAGAALLHEVWRRYFPHVSAWIAAAGALALGLAASAPILVQRAEVYEVAISCAYALTMLALGAVWLALHRPDQRGRWLAAAALAFGLATGARPTALFGAGILIVPLAARGKPAGGRRDHFRLLAVAAIPLILCALGLMFYNFARFGSPWEFGERYQLAANRQDTVQHFSLGYLWFNFRVYFLEPVAWHAGFPFIGKISLPPLPSGHGPVEDPFGILPDVPLVWLALAAPLAWRCPSAEGRPALREFVAAVALLAPLSALPLLLFYWNCSRYELEFLPALVLLAVVGIFGLEHALAGQPARRRLARAGWIVLLIGSIGFNLLAGLERRAEERGQYGNALLALGRDSEAMAEFRGALRIKPGDFDAHNGLGVALGRSGRMPEAIGELQAALQIDPSRADVRTNLANALAQTGRAAEAVAEYEEVCRLQPNTAMVHYNLAYGLQLLGRQAEARAQYQEAIRLDPNLARRAP
jgi:tetratricopeptide (TPR) repeat protein